MKKLDWEKTLRKAGLAGKKAILQNYTESSRHKILGKGMGGDMTLRIDRVSEKAIQRSLKADLGTSFVFLSEEIGEVSATKSQGDEQLPVVVCDPLDGSHNAEVGIPLFCVALSVIMPTGLAGGRTFGNVAHAFICSIKTEDEYLATKGRGSSHNGRRLRPVRGASEGINTLLVECSDVEYLREKILGHLWREHVNKTRLLGSAAISYCMLASNSAEALIFAQPGGARTIDSPAGFLIAREAGCVFANLSAASLETPVEALEVGFDSRANIVGAANLGILQSLEQKLGSLP
jgi:myo-inositol-1(or 4)-monophosphatase